MKKVLCIGDSLTFGNVGYSYIKFLKKLKIINKGLNGDPILGIEKRLKKYMSLKCYEDVDLIILWGGTNDVFLPNLKKISVFWNISNTLRPLLMGYHYCETDEEFHKVYERIIQNIQKVNKKVLLLGLPKAEIKHLNINPKLQERSRMIQELSFKYNLDFIDIYKIMDEINFPTRSLGYSWGMLNLTRIFDAFLMTICPPSKKQFSKMRKLNLTVDGIHLSEVSAKEIAKSIDNYIKRGIDSR